MGGLFSRPTVVQQAAPEPTPPAPMPDTDSAAVREANRREQMRIMSRAGRSSTILTNPDNRGGTYSGTYLGSGN